MAFFHFTLNLSEFCQKKLQRLKAAKELYKKDDSKITCYEKCQFLRLLANRSYHSLEISETDDENEHTTVINVYDLLWKSDEVIRSYIILIFFTFIKILTNKC